ncbi:hypothetical protein EXU48_19860 [Occultella glacieicola]|uniref:GH16 domain-containing protein n=2 Tax=Occultella TaxID=2828348 RepID=A0A7M4DQR2_9MICO|nr:MULTISPECIES: DUF6772 family protein [Occultella]TDE89680.1 hypothetical protein EXU48_19860 [Occultella glacieicola]VZO39806.1 hypothetical protein HALOF300_04503 [Occultella aeris]
MNAADGFEPLSQILLDDDFDRGLQGWTLLTGNYEGSLDTILPEQRDFRPPMLSNLTMWDTGTAGSLHGSYAMKLATRARRDSIAVALKRLTFRRAQPIRVEGWVTSKPEATSMTLSDRDVRSFGIFLDLQDDEHRVMPHLRFLNADGDGPPRHQWQYKASPRRAQTISSETRTHFHLGNDQWTDVPDGRQDLCYNELATKQNWHYLRVDFDLATMRYLEFQCNDRVWSGASLEPLTMPAWPNLRGMLNVGFWVDANTDSRSFLYVDSVMLSTGVIG